jgi:hypothetical protein
MSAWLPGTTETIDLEFTDAVTGIPADPSSVQLDITYGSALGDGAPDYAGPFSYTGASAPTPGQIYRTGAGLYAYAWPIPASATGGVYVANWTVVYGGDTFGGWENLLVQGAGLTPPNNGDIGFWTASLTYGSLQLNLGAQDTNGVAWALLGVDGMDGAPTDGQVIQRAGDHGGYATPQFYGARPITMRVRATAPSQAARDGARALVQQVVPVSDLATLVYDEPIPKTLMVRRSGVLHESYPTLVDVDFTIGLLAPDPRKYGARTSVTVIANSQTLGVVYPLTYPVTYPAQAPPGAATVTNGGNFETRPLIAITGPVTGPAVYNQTSGQTISFSTLTLGTTDQLVIDLLAKVAYLNGAQLPADLWSSWWVLDPGTSQIILQGAGGAGATMTISFNDAWM